MAAKTPDSVKQDKLGTVRLIYANFTSTNLDDTDTYATGIDGIIGAWFSPDSTKGVVGVSNSAGTLTFACSADNQTGTLFILARS